LTTFFDGTGCVSSSSWDKCEFYGTTPAHLSISSTYPFALTADISVTGGYAETFIISCTDNAGTYVSLPTSFTENCVTKPVSPAVVIPSHYYDPVHEKGDVIVNNTLTTFFVGSDCIRESDWLGCEFIEPNEWLTISQEYPFPITAVVDYAPGYTTSFEVECGDRMHAEFVALTTKFSQERDQYKPTEDYVKSLPEMEDFPYGVYSGYVPLTNTSKEIYYMLVESQNDWKTDPLLIWLNGGPGCSSMLGWATENGPWLLKEGETTFMKN